MKIPLSKIGPYQRIDIKRSKRPFGEYERICKVIDSKNWHGDLGPCRIAKVLNKKWEDYDTQFVVQVAGCPLNCYYCYVDNLSIDNYFSVEELVDLYLKYKKNVNKLNVFHLMGGCPGKYPKFWKNLRVALDSMNLNDDIILSDVIFVENHFYGVKPWEYLDKINNFFIQGCLKGTTRESFYKNTENDLFDIAIKEMSHYIQFDNLWITLIEYDNKGIKDILEKVNFNKIDWLRVVQYEVTKHKEMILYEEGK